MENESLRIAQLETAFEAHGYFVSGEAIPGQETAWLETLRAGFAKVERVMAYNARQYGMRGRSKRALDALHRELPQPAFGVEVAR